MIAFRKVAGVPLIAIGCFSLVLAAYELLIGPAILGVFFIYQGYVYLTERPIIDPIKRPSTTVHDSGKFFDTEKRALLIEQLATMGQPKFLSIDQFFDGNIDDQNSIGCNLYPNHPGVQRIREVLEELRRREDVEEVLIQVVEDEPDENSWPYSDRVFVLGNIPKSELLNAVKEIGPMDYGNASRNIAEKLRNLRDLNKSPITELVWD